MQSFFEKIAAFVSTVMLMLGAGGSAPESIIPADPVLSLAPAIAKENVVLSTPKELACTLTSNKNPAVVGETITLSWTTSAANDVRLNLATEKGGSASESVVPSSGFKEVKVIARGLLPYKVTAKGPNGTKECKVTLRSYQTAAEAKIDSMKAIAEKPVQKSTIRNTFYVEANAGDTFTLEDDSAQIEILTVRDTEIELKIRDDNGVRTQVLKQFYNVDAGTYTMAIVENKIPLTIHVIALEQIPSTSKPGAGPAPKGSSAMIARDMPFSTSSTPYFRGTAIGVTSLDVRFLDIYQKLVVEYPVKVVSGKWELQVPKPLPQGRYMIDFCCTAMPGGYYTSYTAVSEKQPVISFGVTLDGVAGSIPTTALTVLPGQKFNLTWSVQNADSCKLQSPESWEPNTIALSGSQMITAAPMQRNMSYTIECTNGPIVGDYTPTSSATIKVQVQAASPTM